MNPTKVVTIIIMTQEEIINLKNNALALINTTGNLTEVEDLRVKYLGRKGEINKLLSHVPSLPKDERTGAGRIINQAKQSIELAIDERLRQLRHEVITKDWMDMTIPGKDPGIGHVHLITQAIEEITHIFEKIGFTRVRYPTVDWDWYAFGSLNMPTGHPARDEWETFFVDAPAHSKKGQMVLTPHTSNGQVREMERVGKPPIRMLNIARCFRRQQDATHLQAFFQFEGLVVDKGISISHLKGTIDYFAREFYGKDAVSRLRPFHFQFTEPSFEVDFSCANCRGTGINCRLCKSGWHEVGGAGMVHPVVLKNGGVDPEIYSGFAFGWGVERSYSMKKGVNIHDIRLINSTDMRILTQY